MVIVHTNCKSMLKKSNWKFCYKCFLSRYAEAEYILTEDSVQSSHLDDVITEYGDQAAFVFMLLAKIALKTERKQRAIEAFKKALKLNPFLWSTFESLCNIGDKPNPNTYFHLTDLENLSLCSGTNINNVDSFILPNSTPQDNIIYNSTPPQILTNTTAVTNNTSMKMFTPDTSEVHPFHGNAFNLSGFNFLSKPKKTRSPMFLESSAEVSCAIFIVS